MMKRIGFAVAFVLIAGVVFAGGGQEPKSGSGQYKFVYGGGDAIGSLMDESNVLAIERIKERSKGTIDVDWYPANQLGSDVELMQSVIAGNQTFWGDGVEWLGEWMPDYNILGWGYAFRDRDHMQKFLKSAAFKELSDAFENKYKVKTLAVTAVEPRILFSKKPVRTLADIQNIKMRVPEIEAYLRFWEAIGTKPSRVTAAEIYMGLSQGVIEACEYPTASGYSAKFHEAAPNVTITQHIQSTYGILMNKNHYDSLTPELQKVVQDAASEAVAYCDSKAVERKQEALDKMREEGATIIDSINVKEWQDKVAPATTAMEEKGMWARGLYNAIQQIK
jgi:tripartite ATP-independent transporter DctP family solute receptor